MPVTHNLLEPRHSEPTGGLKSRRVGPVLIAITIALGGLYVNAQSESGPPELLLKGVLGGTAEDMVVVNDVGFVSRGTRLVSMSFSNPETPLEMGSTGLPAEIRAMVADESNVYAALEDGTLSVLDVTDPQNPQVVGGIPLVDVDYIVDMAVQDGRVFVGSQTAGVGVYDVNEPASPVEVHREVAAPLGVTALAVDGDHLYVIPGGALGFKVWDIAVAKPTMVGEAWEPRGARDIAIVNDTGYVVDQYKGLTVFNVQDPSNPQHVGSLEVRPDANDHFEVGQGHVFIASSDVTSRHLGGVVVIDVASPSTPREIAQLPIAGKSVILGKFVLENGFLYEVSSGKVRIIDVRNPSAPQLRGALRILERSNDAAVLGDFAYLAAWEAGLRIIDIAEPQHPREVGVAEWTGVARAIVAHDGYAYVVSGIVTSTLYIVDVRSPQEPRSAGQLSLGRNADSAVLQGGHLFLPHRDSDVGDESLQVSMYSLEVPERPRKVREFREQGVFAVQWPYIFFGQEDTVEAVNLEDIQAPRHLLTIEKRGEIKSLVATKQGILVLHETNATLVEQGAEGDMKAVRNIAVGQNAQDIWADDEFAYVSYSERPEGRLVAIALGNEPMIVAQFDMTVKAVRPTVSSLVVAGEPALVILQRPSLGTVPVATPVGSPTATPTLEQPLPARIFVPVAMLGTIQNDLSYG